MRRCHCRESTASSRPYRRLGARYGRSLLPQSARQLRHPQVASGDGDQTIIIASGSHILGVRPWRPRGQPGRSHTLPLVPMTARSASRGRGAHIADSVLS